MKEFGSDANALFLFKVPAAAVILTAFTNPMGRAAGMLNEPLICTGIAEDI